MHSAAKTVRERRVLVLEEFHRVLADHVVRNYSHVVHHAKGLPQATLRSPDSTARPTRFSYASMGTSDLGLYSPHARGLRQRAINRLNSSKAPSITQLTVKENNIMTCRMNIYGRSIEINLESACPTKGIRLSSRNKISRCTNPFFMCIPSTLLNPISDAIENER